MKRLIQLCVLSGAVTAQASGFYLGDNGAKAMVQGGAFTAQADDATAMQHNPAGLAQQQGFSFLADLQVLRHDVSFWRQDPGFDPAAPSTLAQEIRNRPDPFLLPAFGASYGFELFGRAFTVGLGIFAPPAQGRTVFPSPNYEKNEMGQYVEKANKYAPQRYALISNDIFIAYPTLSAAYAVHPRFQVGVSLQLTLSRFQQTQVLYGGDIFGESGNPKRQVAENPDYDALVGIDLPGEVGFTGILGLMAQPTDWLSLGASVRPPVPFKARGKLTATLSKFFQDQGAEVKGDTATLAMTMPLEVRAGARVTPFKELGVNFDFVYQGWNSVDQLLLTPENVTLSSPLTGDRPIPPFGVKKNWLGTWSVRLGATYRPIQWVSVSAGAMYETGAAPSSTFSVDWSHPSRFILTAGVTGHLGPIDLIAGGLYSPTVTTVVTDSAVIRGQTDPTIVPGTIGDGIYTSGAWGLIFGVRGHFGGGVKEAPAAPAPAPVPTSGS